jgi:hypothetical protein
MLAMLSLRLVGTQNCRCDLLHAVPAEVLVRVGVGGAVLGVRVHGHDAAQRDRPAGLGLLLELGDDDDAAAGTTASSVTVTSPVA